MIFNVYTTRNKKSAAFGKLDMQLMDNQQAIENYSTAYLEANDNDKILFKELELYYLGQYDTTSGKMLPVEPVMLLDIGAVAYEGRKEEK